MARFRLGRRNFVLAGGSAALSAAAQAQSAPPPALIPRRLLFAVPERSRATISPDGKLVAFSYLGDIWVVEAIGGKARSVTMHRAHEINPVFSPDGRFIAFVRNNNLYVVDAATQRERQLTTDGNENMLDGIFDWVYQEEVYGRGNFRGYWWSPDSSHIVYLQLDERPVKRFTVVDHIPTMQKIELEPYPKAGFPNPIAKLFTVAANGTAPHEVNTEPYSGGDFLIVSVDWTPDSSKVVYQIQNREQTWLDVNMADLSGGGTPKTLFRETTKAWVEPDHNQKITWLKDGSFLWLSERSGFKHLYQYTADGTLEKQITNGPWEVRSLHGIDNHNDWIYFSGTERSVLGTDVYRVHLDGSGLARLSDAAGEHRAIFNPAMTQYVDSWGDIQTPPQVSLLRNDGSRVRVIDTNEVTALFHLRRHQTWTTSAHSLDAFQRRVESTGSQTTLHFEATE